MRLAWSPLAASLSLLVVSACASPEDGWDDALEGSAQPIIHGSPTPAGQFPATGALLYNAGGGNWSAGCTGTLVAPDVVITAAHCLRDDISGPGLPRFTMQHDARLVSEGDSVAARSKHPHPAFDLSAASELEAPFKANDIGVLRLATPITGVPYATLATGPESAMLNAGAVATIVGYGLTEGGGQSAGTKYNADTPVTQVGQYEIYLGNPGDPQNCNGDSGGPAYVTIGGKQRLMGVTSRGVPNCGQGGLDTRVEPYIDWINQTLGATCGEGGTCEISLGDGGSTGGDDDDGGCGCTVGGRGAAGGGGLALVGLGLGAAALARRRRQRASR